MNFDFWNADVNISSMDKQVRQGQTSGRAWQVRPAGAAGLSAGKLRAAALCLLGAVVMLVMLVGTPRTAIGDLAWKGICTGNGHAVAARVPFAELRRTCPFCAAVNLTFAEQIGGNDVVVVANLLEPAEPMAPDAMELPTAGFEITEVVKGSTFVEKGMKFRAVLVGAYEKGQSFLVMGVDPPNLIWSTPLKCNPRVIEYIHKLDSLPAGGGKRLEFFQDYLEDAESVLAFDAYDEFARAPYADLIEMKDQMRREQLVAWILNPETAVNRRRLYFTMLGVCGQTEDIEMLEELIRSGDRQKQAGLDALVGCYLILKGEAGLPLIEEQLLANPEVDYVDTLAAVSAIRFMGTESKLISTARLCQSLRTLLKRPDLADMIIPDLARWQDWSVLDQLAGLFREAKGETVWLRVAIFQYLRECPLPEARKYNEELAKLDPKAFQRASFFTDFGFSDAPTPPEGATRGPDDQPGDGKKEPAEGDGGAAVGDGSGKPAGAPGGVPADAPATGSGGGSSGEGGVGNGSGGSGGSGGGESTELYLPVSIHFKQPFGFSRMDSLSNRGQRDSATWLVSTGLVRSRAQSSVDEPVQRSVERGSVEPGTSGIEVQEWSTDRMPDGLTAEGSLDNRPSAAGPATGAAGLAGSGAGVPAEVPSARGMEPGREPLEAAANDQANEAAVESGSGSDAAAASGTGLPVSQPVVPVEPGVTFRPVLPSGLSAADRLPVTDATAIDPLPQPAGLPSEGGAGPRFYTFLLPVGSGMVIFLLLWSVINGWFERLIF